MANLAQGDVFQVSFRQSMNGQRVLNIYHWVVQSIVAGTIDTVTASRVVAEYFATAIEPSGIGEDWPAAVVEELKFEQVRAQLVHPVRRAYESEQLAIDGGVTSSSPLVQNVALSVQKKTASSGQRFVGRAQLAGIDTIHIENGEWNNTALGLAEAAQNWMLGDHTLTPLSGSFVIAQCIYHPQEVEHYTLLTDVIPQKTVRTMHRRTVRVGE